MALIYPGMLCAICSAALGVDEDRVATSHFIDDADHPLWPFSDAAMHRACFVAWEHREEFVSLYNSTLGAKVWRNGTRHQMRPDGSIETVRLKASLH